MSYDTNNIFAKILRGEIPCDKVYEDDYALAFYDITPHTPIHILVIPKGAYTDIVDFGANATPEEISGFYRAAAHIARDVGITDKGFRAIANMGANSGQEVPHYHLHLLGGRKVGPMVSKA